MESLHRALGSKQASADWGATHSIYTFPRHPRAALAEPKSSGLPEISPSLPPATRFPADKPSHGNAFPTPPPPILWPIFHDIQS